jgi:hypothetical protein
VRGIYLKTDPLRTDKSIIYDYVPIENCNYNTYNYASIYKTSACLSCIVLGVRSDGSGSSSLSRAQVVGTKPLPAVTGGRTGVMPSSRAHSVGPVWADTRLARLGGF